MRSCRILDDEHHTRPLPGFLVKHVKVTAAFTSWAQHWMDSLDVDWEQLSFVAAFLDDVEEAFCTVIFDLEIVFDHETTIDGRAFCAKDEIWKFWLE